MTALLIIGAGPGVAATLALVERSAELRIAACIVVVDVYGSSIEVPRCSRINCKWQKVKLERDLRASKEQAGRQRAVAALIDPNQEDR
jgi:hypothetical protein